MAKIGFSKEGNLREIKRGNLALSHLLSGTSAPFTAIDVGLFKSNNTYTTGQRLDFIPNNYRFQLRIDSPNVDENSTAIRLQNINDSSPNPVIGTKNLSVQSGDAILNSPTSTKDDNFIIFTSKPQELPDTGSVNLTRQIRNGEGPFYIDNHVPNGFGAGKRFDITGVTKANPAVITISGTNDQNTVKGTYTIKDGDVINITGIADSSYPINDFSDAHINATVKEVKIISASVIDAHIALQGESLYNGVQPSFDSDLHKRLFASPQVGFNLGGGFFTDKEKIFIQNSGTALDNQNLFVRQSDNGVTVTGMASAFVGEGFYQYVKSSDCWEILTGGAAGTFFFHFHKSNNRWQAGTTSTIAKSTLHADLIYSSTSSTELQGWWDSTNTWTGTPVTTIFGADSTFVASTTNLLHLGFKIGESISSLGGVDNFPSGLPDISGFSDDTIVTKGMSNIHGSHFVKRTGASTLELYTDAELTSGLNLTTSSDFTNGRHSSAATNATNGLSDAIKSMSVRRGSQGLIFANTIESQSETVTIVKKNQASYSPANGRFTFGTDIPFTYTNGDLVSKVFVKGHDNTPFEIAKGSSYFQKKVTINETQVPFGSSFYPLIVSNFNIAANGQKSFILKRKQTNSPVFFQMKPSADPALQTYGAVTLVGEVSGGTYTNDAEDGTQNIANGSGSHPLEHADSSGSGLELQVTRELNTITAARVVNGGSGYKIGDIITIPKENTASGTQDATAIVLDVLSQFVADSPQVMLFNSPNIVSFERQLPVSSLDFTSNIPPAQRASGGPGNAYALQQAAYGDMTGSYDRPYTYFESIGPMYNINGAFSSGFPLYQSTEDDGYLSTSGLNYTSTDDGIRSYNTILTNIESNVGQAQIVSQNRFTQVDPYHNKSENEIKIDGSLQIHDPALKNSPGGTITRGGTSVSAPGYDTFDDCPFGPAVYIKEGDTYNRAFSTFDGPWESDSTAGNKKIFTKGNYPAGDGSAVSDFTSDLKVARLVFEDRVIVQNYSSSLIQDSDQSFMESLVNAEAGSDLSNASPRSTGFDYKMPIIVKQLDETTGEESDQIYYLLLRSTT